MKHCFHSNPSNERFVSDSTCTLRNNYTTFAINLPINRLIAEDSNWRPINVSQSAVDSNWRPAGSEWFRRFYLTDALLSAHIL